MRRTITEQSAARIWRNAQRRRGDMLVAPGGNPALPTKKSDRAIRTLNRSSNFLARRARQAAGNR